LTSSFLKIYSKAGGICNGKPGFRKEYADTYYAAFVLDPVGNNVEALHFVPETAI
jgi:hypothetical protein